MEITRTEAPDALMLAVAGRLDGYWADHLDKALADAVREGHHQLRLDLAQIVFLSSAGIAVLVKVYKQLGTIGGSLVVVNPSATVHTVLQITKLAGLLLGSDTPAPVTAAAAAAAPSTRVERGDAILEAFELQRGATLACRVFGDPAPLAGGAFTAEACTSLGSRSPQFALGVGAFGEGFDDCRPRFGELVSVAGATAYQPADGTNVADYLVSSGPLSSDVHLLYGLAAEGHFSHLVRFEPRQAGGTLGLSSLVAGCLEIAGSSAVGLVIVAEAASLVGAALRRSPAMPIEGETFFDHPGIRTRLTFTAERAHHRTLALVAGIVSPAQGPFAGAQLRPVGVAGHVGHLHAASFPFRPVRKGRIDLHETVASLFESEQVLGVLHLLCDDRGDAGAGESEFNRGACWIAPLGKEA
jgi:anti-anti-sigma factor